MFLDTSGLFCLLHEREPLHGLAVQLYGEARNLIMHDHVLIELVSLCNARGVPRRKTLAYVRDLLADPTIEQPTVNRQLVNEAVDLLFNRLDKSYSLCDAISFVIMRAAGETEALTTDKHFEQEGFHRLLVE